MIKKIWVLAQAALLFSASIALAATALTYTTKTGDTLQSVASANGTTTAAIVAANPNLKLAVGQTLVVGYQTTVAPTTTPATSTGEIIIKNAYTTAYGWPDNTPPGANTTIQGVSGKAGGSGTFADPITMATGYTLSSGKETDDYAAGTKFYDPNLRKYFVIGDTCGDGNSPQTESCHKSEIAGTIQLDMWVGGQGLSNSGTLKCEDNITRVGTLIENPASNYAVVAGSIYSSTGCATQFGDAVVTQ